MENKKNGKKQIEMVPYLQLEGHNSRDRDYNHRHLGIDVRSSQVAGNVARTPSNWVVDTAHS